MLSEQYTTSVSVILAENVHNSLFQLLNCLLRGFPSGSAVRIVMLMQETWVQSLHLEDPPEKEMATHSSILACETPWT